MNITIASENDMKRVGETIGRALTGGECIELIGDIGAGKTTLTKGIARGMDIVDTVQSPTFTINRTYQAPSGIRLSHYDFYRLNDSGIMAEELAETLEDPQAAIVIEWGDIVGDVMPKDSLRIAFASPSEETRTLALSAGGARSQAIMKALA